MAEIDPTTIFLVGVFMALANGAVLGLIDRDLPEDLRPSAASWRIGTLMLACGSLLLTLQDLLPRTLLLPLANLLVNLGVTGYWRSLGQFYRRRDGFWLYLPALLLTPLFYLFTETFPHLGARVVIATSFWVIVLLGCLRVLWSVPREKHSLSSRMMQSLVTLVMVFMAVRLGYFVFHFEATGSVMSRGHWINVLTPLVMAILPVVGTTAFLLMCTERIRRRWERAASTDPLTGLANRRTLTAEGERRLASAGRAPGGTAVVLIDVDHFKRINDRHGHEIGDLALKQVAEVLNRCCRPGDLAARHGGEEFVMLLSGIGEDDLKALGERVRAAVAEAPLRLATGEVAMTVSIGLALAEPGEVGLDNLLRRADQALYAAKDGGRNRVRFQPR